MVTLIELQNTEGTLDFQKLLKFDRIDLWLTSDFSFKTPITKKSFQDFQGVSSHLCHPQNPPLFLQL